MYPLQTHLRSNHPLHLSCGTTPCRLSRSLFGRRLHRSTLGGAARAWADESNDHELAKEFGRVTNPEKYKELGEHLDLLWSASDSVRARVGLPACACCRQRALTEPAWSPLPVRCRGRSHSSASAAKAAARRSARGGC